MTFTRVTAVFAALFYVFLWVLDLNGVSSLMPVLVVPPVLAALVAFGVWLNNFMGVAPRRPHFADPDEDTTAHVATSRDPEHGADPAGDPPA
ncbi:MAG: hypothetical protein HIU57_06720 [Acidobacteria bacterium]|nr:hypothetical protein [Acidobacteriota bacterium]